MMVRLLIWPVMGMLMSIAVEASGEARQAFDPLAEKVLVTAHNPDPSVYPTLHVRHHSPGVVFLTAFFPDIPDLRLDSAAYEAGEGFLTLDFLSAKVSGDNRIEMRHSVRDFPNLIHVTHLRAETGAIEVEATLELDSQATDSAEVPESILIPNMCWGLDRGPAFSPGGTNVSTAGETPELYPTWIKRCFVFTEEGQTFLDRTLRRKTPEVPSDDPRNDPPWSQHYVGVWQYAGGPSRWPNTSLTRYQYPLIGAVSNDEKHLVGLGAESTWLTAQAWHTCFHHIPHWTPVDAPLLERKWKMKFYAFENDPEALVQRYLKDFPGAAELSSRQVPADPPAHSFPPSNSGSK